MMVQTLVLMAWVHIVVATLYKVVDVVTFSVTTVEGTRIILVVITVVAVAAVEIEGEASVGSLAAVGMLGGHTTVMVVLVTVEDLMVKGLVVDQLNSTVTSQA